VGKWLWTEQRGGAPICLAELEDGEREAVFIAESIGRSRRQDPADRIAILYRTNAQSRQIEEALRRYSVSYHVVGGFSFYQRAEVKDVLAYLKVLASPEDSVNLLRVINTPARGIGRTTLEAIERHTAEHRIGAWAAIGRMLVEGLLPVRAAAALAAFHKLIEDLRETASHDPIHLVLRQILDRTGYRRMLQNDSSPAAESRLENLEELLNAAVEAAERGESIGDFLDHAALVSDSDQLDESAPVSLLTLHNAKGLEFPEVFIAGLEEGLCPHGRSLSSESMLEEERRLCYVGMTRAQRRLTLSWARARRRFGAGSLQEARPSRFLSEVPRELTVNLHSLAPPEIDLDLEQGLVRESVKRTTYTGKTYNSLDHIEKFFAARGLPQPAETARAAPRTEAPAPAAARPGRKKGRVVGSIIEHPRFGRGTVVRCEGEGEEAKLTVSFPGYGLRKLAQKYAGLKIRE
jgi:DNA helicase-2/ATP-dependent DNA helicase PcrA